jgi:hypothetical protein
MKALIINLRLFEDIFNGIEALKNMWSFFKLFSEKFGTFWNGKIFKYIFKEGGGFV